MLDCIEAVELVDQGQVASGLHMAVDELDVLLHIADGQAGAESIVDRLASYTRTAPLKRVDAYEDAKRRLRAREVTKRPFTRKAMLLVGTHAVTAQDHILVIGNVLKYRVGDVLDYAHQAEDLPLANGGKLQAALAALVVAAQEREDDFSLLAKRVAAYEDDVSRARVRHKHQ